MKPGEAVQLPLLPAYSGNPDPGVGMFRDLGSRRNGKKNSINGNAQQRHKYYLFQSPYFVLDCIMLQKENSVIKTAS